MYFTNKHSLYYRAYTNLRELGIRCSSLSKQKSDFVNNNFGNSKLLSLKNVNTNKRLLSSLTFSNYKRNVNIVSIIDTFNIFGSSDMFLKYAHPFFKCLNSQLRPITNRANTIPAAIHLVILILILPVLFSTAFYNTAVQRAKNVCLPTFVWIFETYLKCVHRTACETDCGLTGIVQTLSYPIDVSIYKKIVSNLTVGQLKSLFQGTAFATLIQYSDSIVLKQTLLEYNGKNKFLLELKKALEAFDFSMQDFELVDSITNFFILFNTYFYRSLDISTKVIDIVNTDVVGFHKFRNSVNEEEYNIQVPALKSFESADTQTKVLIFLTLFQPLFKTGNDLHQSVCTKQLPYDTVIATYDISLTDTFLALLSVTSGKMVEQKQIVGLDRPQRLYSTLASGKRFTGELIECSYFRYKLRFTGKNILRLIN